MTVSELAVLALSRPDVPTPVYGALIVIVIIGFFALTVKPSESSRIQRILNEDSKGD
jgi:hypothetical protein